MQPDSNIPLDPLTVSSTESGWSTFWELREIGSDQLEFHGKTFLWHILGGLVIAAAIGTAFTMWPVDKGLALGLTLFPLFYAGRMTVASLMSIFRPKALIDRPQRIVVLGGSQRVSWDNVICTQLLEVTVDLADSGPGAAWQWNLVYRDGENIQRYNLTQGIQRTAIFEADRRLRALVGIPLGTAALSLEMYKRLPARRQERSVGWLFLIGSIAFGLLWCSVGVVKQIDNPAFWLGLALPLFGALVGWRVLRQVREQDDARLCDLARLNDSASV